MKVSRGEGLDRYYLLKLWGFGVFLHRIHHSDPDGVFHNHPWSGLSIIFGSYIEWLYVAPGLAVLRRRRWFNWVWAKRFHSVHIRRPVWTLFFHLRKSNQWAVIDDEGRRVEAPWEGEGTGRSYRQALQ